MKGDTETQSFIVLRVSVSPCSLNIKAFAPLRLCVEKKLLKTQKYSDKCLQILEEFKNENHLAANSRVLRVHLLSPEQQHVTTKTAKVCNFLSAFFLP